jgi:hypothetical protein
MHTTTSFIPINHITHGTRIVFNFTGGKIRLRTLHHRVWHVTAAHTCPSGIQTGYTHQRNANIMANTTYSRDTHTLRYISGRNIYNVDATAYSATLLLSHICIGYILVSIPIRQCYASSRAKRVVAKCDVP